MARAHLIPHPLCTLDKKEVIIYFQESEAEKESLTDYIKHSSNPRWAAYHIVMSLLNGMHDDRDASKALTDAANMLRQTKRK